MDLSSIRLDVAPYRLTGTVYEALLNDPADIDALGAAVEQAPYKGAPKAPVLAVKPRHTLVASGSRVEVPDGAEALVVGASLGIVVGRAACRVPEADALAWVAGYVVACDLSLPLASHYRPAVRQRARDGFCPIGTDVVAAASVADPDRLDVVVRVNDRRVHATGTAGRRRGVARLLADVTEFMTLQAGDVLLLGPSHGAPLARAGDAVRVEIAGVGALDVALVPEAVAAGARA